MTDSEIYTYVEAIDEEDEDVLVSAFSENEDRDQTLSQEAGTI